jgi:hypothetical protein
MIIVAALASSIAGWIHDTATPNSTLSRRDIAHPSPKSYRIPTSL